MPVSLLGVSKYHPAETNIPVVLWCLACSSIAYDTIGAMFQNDTRCIQYQLPSRCHAYYPWHYPSMGTVFKTGTLCNPISAILLFRDGIIAMKEMEESLLDFLFLRSFYPCYHVKESHLRRWEAHPANCCNASSGSV